MLLCGILRLSRRDLGQAFTGAPKFPCDLARTHLKGREERRRGEEECNEQSSRIKNVREEKKMIHV